MCGGMPDQCGHLTTDESGAANMMTLKVVANSPTTGLREGGGSTWNTKRRKTATKPARMLSCKRTCTWRVAAGTSGGVREESKAWTDIAHA